MTPKRNQNSNKLSKLKALQRHLDQKDIFAMWNRPVFISMAAYLRIEFKISSTSSLHGNPMHGNPNYKALKRVYLNLKRPK